MFAQCTCSMGFRLWCMGGIGVFNILYVTRYTREGRMPSAESRESRTRAESRVVKLSVFSETRILFTPHLHRRTPLTVTSRVVSNVPGRRAPGWHRHLRVMSSAQRLLKWTFVNQNLHSTHFKWMIRWFNSKWLSDIILSRISRSGFHFNVISSSTIVIKWNDDCHCAIIEFLLHFGCEHLSKSDKC